MSSKDLVSRGQYGSSLLGTTIFVGLRFFDGFILQRVLQRLDIVPQLCAKLGLAIPPLPPSGGPPVTFLGQYMTPFQAVLWAMHIGVALKHILWVTYICKEQMTPQLALIVAGLSTFFNSVSTLAFNFASVNPTWSEQAFKACITWFVIGLAVETGSELQRKWFKDDPKNKGKPYAGGLFGYARSINYMGYMLSKGAMSTAGAGWVWGAVVAGFVSFDFVTRAIPVLDEYCAKRYGTQWEEVKRKVPYAYIPFVY